MIRGLIDFVRYAAFRKTCRCPGCRNATDPWTRS